MLALSGALASLASVIPGAAQAHGAVPFGTANVLHACRALAGGATRIVQSNNCSVLEEPLQWNITGPSGPQGAAGPQGATGASGASGAQGPAGPEGAAGVQGPAGPIGATGAQGAVGPTGPAGSQGLAGPVGPAGSTDTSDQVRDKFFEGTACIGNDPTDVMVKVGPLCVDVYEASVWNQKVGGQQFAFPYCDSNGNGCTNFFSRSVANALPANRISWFQAQQACANAGKRLLTNAEWQMAAAGTPDDPISCNTQSGAISGGTESGRFS